MKKYRAIWKIEPTFEINEGEDLEEKEHDCLMDITMNPHDFIEFEEVDEEIGLKEMNKKLIKECNRLEEYKSAYEVFLSIWDCLDKEQQKELNEEFNKIFVLNVEEQIKD